MQPLQINFNMHLQFIHGIISHGIIGLFYPGDSIFERNMNSTELNMNLSYVSIHDYQLDWGKTSKKILNQHELILLNTLIEYFLVFENFSYFL